MIEGGGNGWRGRILVSSLVKDKGDATIAE